MQKEDIALLAQLLTGMKDALYKLEEAYKKKDEEYLNRAKKEIISLQIQIDKIL